MTKRAAARVGDGFQAHGGRAEHVGRIHGQRRGESWGESPWDSSAGERRGLLRNDLCRWRRRHGREWTVFKLSATGVQTTLVSFTGGGGTNPGSSPDGGLVQGSDGSLYGTTFGGGSGGLGTVFKLTLPAVVLTLVEGTAGTQAGGMFSDGAGNATVTLTASTGTVTQNNSAGTWNWSPAAGFDGPSSTAVTITATGYLRTDGLGRVHFHGDQRRAGRRDLGAARGE